MGCQRSNYACEPYTRGFEYAIKMREMNDRENPINPYLETDTDLHQAFYDGYRDGMYTAGFHGIRSERGI